MGDRCWVTMEIRGWGAAGDEVCRNVLCHRVGVRGAWGSVGNTTRSQAGPAGLCTVPRGHQQRLAANCAVPPLLPLSIQGKMPFRIAAVGSFFQAGLGGPETWQTRVSSEPAPRAYSPATERDAGQWVQQLCLRPLRRLHKKPRAVGRRNDDFILKLFISLHANTLSLLPDCPPPHRHPLNSGPRGVWSYFWLLLLSVF